MKVLVFEPAKGGHHLIFLRYFLEDLLAGGHEVYLGAEYKAQPSSELTEALGGLLQRIHWVPLSNGPGRLLHGRRLDALARAQEKTGADRVFACCIDHFSSALFRRSAWGLPAPAELRGRVSGLFLRPRVADLRQPAAKGIKARGFRRLIQSGWFDRFFVLDESLLTHLTPGLDAQQFTALPDPWSGDFTADKMTARAALGLPAEKFLFLHYGTSSPRKGLPTVLRAAMSLPADSACALVAAGRFSGRDSLDSSTLSALKASGRAYLFDRYITDAEEPLFFRACDAVVLAYEGHYGSSNVQGRAAAAGRAVISSDEGLVGHRTRTYHLGLTFPTGDAQALAAAILKARDTTTEQVAPGLAEYARLHSREAFRRILLSALGT